MGEIEWRTTERPGPFVLSDNNHYAIVMARDCRSPWPGVAWYPFDIHVLNLMQVEHNSISGNDEY